MGALMPSTADYGSTFGVVVFVQELALLAYCLIRYRYDDAAGDGSPSAEVKSAEKRIDNGNERLDEDTRFLFDVVARQNEGMIQNIDALDNALIAVTVGIFAIALFTADKWYDLEPNFRFAGLFFLGESAVVALGGYLTVYVVARGEPDLVRLWNFAMDYADSAVKATSAAIADITRCGKTNVVVRRYKRTFVLPATLLAGIAAGVIVAGRAFGAPF